MNYAEPAVPALAPQAQAADLVRALVHVIEELTHADTDGRFTSIREYVDVSEDVDPVLAAAQAYLASLPPIDEKQKGTPPCR
mgnify:CR=1 FL=1